MKKSGQEHLVLKLKTSLERTRAEYRHLEATHSELLQKYKDWECDHKRTLELNERLAKVNAESAELMAELEEKNQTLITLNERLAEANAAFAELMAELDEKNETLRKINKELARANAYGAELTAMVELKSEEIETLNQSISRANVRGADLMAELELKMELVNKLNLELRKEVRERRKAEKALKLKNQELEVANKIKSEFVGIVSHDFGNPLSIIQMNCELMLMKTYGELPEKVTLKLEKVFAAAQRLNKLRVDTLDLTKMDLGKLEITKEEGDLAGLAWTVVEEMTVAADRKQQTIRLTTPKKLLLSYDSTRLFQILQNYVSNAIRYSPDEASIEVELEERENEVLCRVRDTGRGIDPRELESVFLAFYRTGEHVKGSTGLGLSIVKGIVEAHGGKAWAESKGEGKGSTFFFSLPK